MKRLYLLLLVFYLGCDKSSDPTRDDLFFGHWLYNQDGLLITFKVSQKGDGYTFKDIVINPPGLSTEGYKFEIRPRDRKLNNGGFGEVRIDGEGDGPWLKIRMLETTLFSDAMDVSEMIIEIEEQETVNLGYQTIWKVQ